MAGKKAAAPAAGATPAPVPVAKAAPTQKGFDKYAGDAKPAPKAAAPAAPAPVAAAPEAPKSPITPPSGKGYRPPLPGTDPRSLDAKVGVTKLDNSQVPTNVDDFNASLGLTDAESAAVNNHVQSKAGAGRIKNRDSQGRIIAEQPTATPETIPEPTAADPAAPATPEAATPEAPVATKPDEFFNYGDASFSEQQTRAVFERANNSVQLETAAIQAKAQAEQEMATLRAEIEAMKTGQPAAQPTQPVQAAPPANYDDLDPMDPGAVVARAKAEMVAEMDARLAADRAAMHKAQQEADANNQLATFSRNVGNAISRQFQEDATLSRMRDGDVKDALFNKAFESVDKDFRAGVIRMDSDPKAITERIGARVAAISMELSGEFDQAQAKQIEETIQVQSALPNAMPNAATGTSMPAQDQNSADPMPLDSTEMAAWNRRTADLFKNAPDASTRWDSN